MKFFLESLYKSKFFIFGLMLGFLACILLGIYASKHYYHENYSRLGGGLQPRTASFQATASQIKNLIINTCPKEKILVLIGGSSVFYGSSQPVRHLWTKKLQEDLGGQYCVFNLAAPAGPLVGFASVAFQMVGREYKDSYLVVDSSSMPSLEADGLVWYKPFFWDAYFKNINNFETKNYSEEQFKQLALANRSSKGQAALDRFDQILLGMYLDSLFYFTDLWSYIHYQWGLTIYDPLLKEWFLKPLKNVPDYDYPIDIPKVKTLEHYPKTDSDEFSQAVKVVRDNSYQYYSRDEGNRFNKELLDRGTTAIQTHPLTAIASKILIVSVPESPYFTKRLTQREQDNYADTRIRLLDVWEKEGYQTLNITDVGPEDYGDRSHLNTLGGWKLSKEVATKIARIQGGK